MGDSRAAPGFGHVDLDLGEEGDEAPAIAAPVTHGKRSSDHGEEPSPPSTSRVFGDSSGRKTRRNMAAMNEESTRIVSGDALSNITRRPPAPQPLVGDDGSTRALSSIDALLLAASGAEGEPAPLTSGADASPSGSGVAARDGGRVAAMRELYAKGDAAGALALASGIGDSLAPGPAGDYPDASIVVEFGAEESVDLSDPFGGLILLDDELAAMNTVVPPGPAAPSALQPPRSPLPSVAPQLSLTERHSIPSIRKAAGEIAKLPIDHRAGFLLAHVDGSQTLEEILDVCAMPASEALQLIAKLKELGVIEFE